MANTYTQFNIHIVFAVKGRERIISEKLMDELCKYMHGILVNLKQYPLAIRGYKDHIHVFFELSPASAVSDVIEKVKANSSKWINDNKKVLGHFEWQRGYGGFSYSKSQRDVVINYIMKQKEHHETKMTFKDEYLKMLHDYGIEFKDEYLFEFYE
jgi:REP element-mobilizing transposase RayT